MPSACALDCNTPHRRKELAAGATRQRSTFGPGTRDAVCRLDVPQCRFATAKRTAVRTSSVSLRQEPPRMTRLFDLNGATTKAINTTAQSFCQLRRFCYPINADKVFGTHRPRDCRHCAAKKGNEIAPSHVALTGASGARLALSSNTLRPQCPLWVKSRHSHRKKPCPLYPRKRTFGQRLKSARRGTLPHAAE
jgi:hypothetical protein